MKTKLNTNHRLLMGLLVVGSVFSMIVSSAFTTTNAWAATLVQSGGAALGTQNSVTLPAGTVEFKSKHKDNDHDRDDHQSESDEDSVSTPNGNPLTEVSGSVSGLFIGPTLTSFVVAGIGVRMDSSLIQEWTIANGDNVTVEGYYLGANNDGTFLVTEMDKAQ
jgi:hypothetical protein